jgi:hypothetical protein
MVEICEFTFTSAETLWNVSTKGIESSWYDLKRKLNRNGTECDSSASYYEKISPKGPQLFAVVNNTFAFFHDNGAWHNYRTARNIKCYIIPSSETNSTQES